ncbi:MAG TPA: T9SS type A sorting domain-containing protein [Chitinophagaceae bacterium]|nr:T9SS type A sorting domain-containing protein [Chitinophagaceae bacterium]
MHCHIFYGQPIIRCDMFIYSIARDNCGAADCNISVTGNQNISGDWEIVNNHLIKLRAERDGRKERVYTVSITCTDASENTTSKSVRIIVPRTGTNGNGQGIKSESEPQFEYVEGFNIKAYPNPSSNYFNLQVLSNNYNDKINLKVYDVSGRLVEAKNGIAGGKILYWEPL